MSKSKAGFYWHVSHDLLLEWCYDYEGRVDFIKENKPENERPVRLRLMQPVIGELPTEIVEAGKAYVEVWKAYNEARKAYDEVWKAYNEARKAYDEAIENNLPYLEKLHAKECPDCCWNGKKLVPVERAE